MPWAMAILSCVRHLKCLNVPVIIILLELSGSWHNLPRGAVFWRHKKASTKWSMLVHILIGIFTDHFGGPGRAIGLVCVPGYYFLTKLPLECWFILMLSRSSWKVKS